MKIHGEQMDIYNFFTSIRDVHQEQIDMYKERTKIHDDHK